MFKKLEDKFTAEINKLDGKERDFFFKVKRLIFDGYPKIKPLLILIGMFFIFTRIKRVLGWEETVIVILIIQMWYLRLLNSKFSS